MTRLHGSYARIAGLCASVFFLVAAPVTADPAGPRAMIRELGSLTAAPAWEEVPGSAKRGLRAIYYDSVPWEGRPTKVFAWLGLPEKAAGPVPGIVLVHGGGGTAYRDWVREWNARGFAAISIAVEGQTDGKIPDPGEENGHWQRHGAGGPRRDGIYGDSDRPLGDQWMYHATAATVLARSLLGSLPGVAPDKIGLMGVSWGGVISATVAGLDPRFAFVIPVYGCGSLAEGGGRYEQALAGNGLYRTAWDPFLHLDRAAMPMLWMSWPEDQHFSLVSLVKSSRRAAGPQMLSFVPAMGHGHGPARKRADSHAFAESVVRTGRPWLRTVESSAAGSSRRIALESDRPLDRAVLVHTSDRGFTGDRQWKESAATLSGEGTAYTVSGEIPPGATAWFFNVMGGGLTATVGWEAAR